MPKHKIVDAFARSMRTQFEANESIGGYRVIRPDSMAMYFKWLRDNVDRLENSVMGGSNPEETAEEARLQILADAADVANISAIICENAGALRYLPEDAQ